ncbi:uncharacterized protein LOC110856790 [Folsomia candida]|uniref:uncharacterized protein LOC110856790 n=1 Tax=Folsomia candida TaxID=158441 RepID=UPI000B908B37|nr:uncharacterized protein LOC110856790 [Folsomia candida]
MVSKLWCKFICLPIYLSLLVPHTESQQARNSQWFEDTIDEFLRNAQNNDEATDIQVSTCKISSQQLVATAQATAARVLKGVCNPQEMANRFEDLERDLGTRLTSLTNLLVSVEAKLVEQEQEIKRNHRRMMSVLGGMKKSEVEGGRGSSSSDNSEYRAEEVIGEGEESINSSSGSEVVVTGSTSSSTTTSTTTTTDRTKSILPTNPYGGPRSDEMIKYNSTVHIENGRRVFSYYWVVPGMTYKLSSWGQKRVLRSNSFYIFPRGYRMYLKIIPRYSTSTMYIHVGITRGDYDETLEWPFSYKMRVQVLDQNESKSRAQDLKSRIWDPKELCSATNWRKPLSADNDECVGLGFPHDVIQTPDYIWNDRIAVKLTVHLD